MIYTFDDNGIYQGEFEVVDVFAPVPKGCLIAPPALTGSQVARWIATSWEVLQEHPVAPPAPIPQSVTMRQAELALLDADLLDDIEALIPMLPRSDQISWKRASVVERSNPLVAYVQQTKGMTDAQIDALFVQAATL